MRKIPVVFCIDVEPEDREIDAVTPRDWDGFVESCAFFEEIRPRLEAATGSPVNFSWFFRMDPQVEHTYGSPLWPVQRYGEAVQRLEHAGDELGLHTHAWRWDTKLDRWIADHGDQDWIEHCLRLSFEAYQKAFGRRCACFRFGDHWMNDPTLDLLESLGVRYELTIEPGMRARPALDPGELATGSLPDYTSALRKPYHPSRLDYRKAAGEDSRDGRDLWMIPLSTGRELGRFAPLKRAAKSLGIDLQRRRDMIALNVSFAGYLFQEVLNSVLVEEQSPYLAPVARTDAPVRSRAQLEANMELLLAHPYVERFQFVTPQQAIQLLHPPQALA